MGYIPIILHRKNFQRVYRDLWELESSFRRPLVDEHNAVNSDFNSTIIKYCNAFIVNTGDLSVASNKPLYHYADPSCSLILDNYVTRLSHILARNLTVNSFKFNFYYFISKVTS